MAGGSNLTPTTYTGKDEVLDVLNAAREFVPLNAYEALQKYHSYVAVSSLWQESKRKIDGGTGISDRVAVDNNGAAKHVHPGEPTNPTIVNNLRSIFIPWKSGQTDWSVLDAEYHENKGQSTKLIDLVKERRARAMESMVETLEDAFWADPDASNDRIPYGIQYYLPPITGAQVTAGTGQGAHQGEHASGFSDCMGLDASTYTRWQSYNATWDTSDGSITEEGVRRIARMLRRLKWKAPRLVGDMSDTQMDMKLVAEETIYENICSRARQQNDDLGPDVTMYYNQPLVSGTPVEWVEQLDDTSLSYPMYAVNMNYLITTVLSGIDFKESAPLRDTTQHDVATSYVDVRYNYRTTNRQRLGGLISYVAAS
jgi:hypothetical protein